MGFDFAAVRGAFFDTDKVKNLVDRKRRSAMSKFGAFVRRRAKSSIRNRKKASEPGSPPSSHKGFLKQAIYFSYDQGTRSVVIGPTPLGRGTAPRALEKGGSSTAFRRFKSGGQWRTATRTIEHIRPRPFMQPALAAELPKFLPLLKG